METVAKVIGYVVLFLVVIFFVSALTAFPVKWLVNWLFTPHVLFYVFGTGQISVWQAWGLSFVCATLFKSSNSSK